jgi:signal transduction histidine kinase
MTRLRATRRWTRLSAFVGSLRFKLIGSYVALIFLALFLAGSAIVVLLRDYQQQIRLDQLAQLSASVGFVVVQADRQGAPLAAIQQILRDESNETHVRILLTDRTGLVLEDTLGDLAGTHVPLPEEQRGGPSRYVAANGDLIFMIAPAPRFGPGNRVPNYRVILAVPQASVAQAWWELAPSLSLAAVLSLVVSITVALLLTRSIARPLVQMTRASEEMARGRYDQSIPVHGRDEIARLARAFNAMARQVSSSDRSMRDFLANVSHELKTPLTSIQGFSQAMLDGTISGEEGYHRAAEIINEESAGMRRLVEDLLTLSKIESGQIVMRDEVVDVDKLVAEAMRRAERRAEGSGVRVAVESYAGATVRGDEHWLGQVFTNLVDNAFKHTPPGGRITLRADVIGSQVVLSCHNTGSYIPADDLPRVFERFFQVDRSRAGRAQGSGLGLAIVREVVQAHGGSVEAESHPTFGTTFRVRLPLHTVLERTPLRIPTSRVA